VNNKINLILNIMDIRKLIFKWITGVDITNLKNGRQPVTVNANGQIHITPSVNSELNDNYLFDFKNYASQYNSHGGTFISVPTDPNEGNNVAGGSIDKQPIRKISIKPIDVLNELETIPNPFSLALIDEKIDMLRDKEKIIVQSYAKREISALLERLENRKLYHANKSFFDSFQNTTDEKIQVLLDKYELVMKASDLFVPEFPKEAIDIMKKYIKAVEKICKKKPVFYVIATSDNFKTVEKKRDPILLVQSPFGFYYQILGAWDKEMLILSEL
jgi:hypothetical protein